MADIEIREDNINLGAGDTPAYANTLNFKSPLTASVNAETGVANVGANTSKISDLPAITDAIGNDVLVIVTNASSLPVTEQISVADFFGNVQANAVFNSNVIATANIYVQNTGALIVGNSTVNTVYATGYVSITNGIETANLEPGVFKSGQTSANSTLVSVGANALLNSSSLAIGDSNSNTVVGFGTFSVTNSTAVSTIDPGTLSVGNSTVNVVANGSAIKISNGATSVTVVSPNSTHTSSGNYYLNANGRWSIVTGAYAIAGGANTNIQFNNSSAIDGSNAFSFNKDTNTVLIGNTLIIGNSTVNSTANATTIKLSNSTSNVTVDTGSVFIGNSTVNNKITVGTITVANSSGIANVQAGIITVGSAVVNTSAVAVGANVIANVTALSVSGTATVGNGVVNASALYVGNSLTSATVSKDKIDLGSSSANLVINANAIKISNSSVSIGITLPTSVQYSGTNVFLAANGQWSTVQPVAAIGGSNNQVQFSVSGALGGSNGFLFDATTNAISLGNSSYVATVNSTVIKVGNNSDYALVNTTAFRITNSAATITMKAANTTQANGKFFLNGNGSWVDINTSGLIAPQAPLPAGSNTFIQFNDSGVMAGNAAFTFSKSTNNLVVANNITGASFYANNGYVLIGNSTINTYANSTSIKLSNSSVNTKIAIPTAAQYANTTMFLHANGSWVDLNAVFIGGAAGAEGTVQFASSGGAQIGNSNIKIVGNNTISIANSTSNTKISIPTPGVRNERHYVLHANGEWSHVRRILRIRDDDWFFGRSPQTFHSPGWVFLSNNSVQFPGAPAGSWQTLISGTVAVGGDPDATPGSAYSVLCEAGCKLHGARYYNYAYPGYHKYFDSYWWYWNNLDVDVEFRFKLNNGTYVSDPIEIPFFTVRQRFHHDSGSLSKLFTSIPETPNLFVEFQARLSNPGTDPTVAVKGRRLKVSQ